MFSALVDHMDLYNAVMALSVKTDVLTQHLITENDTGN